MTRRVFWWIVNVALVGLIAGLLTAILLPSWLGPGDQDPENPTPRERRRN